MEIFGWVCYTLITLFFTVAAVTLLTLQGIRDNDEYVGTAVWSCILVTLWYGVYTWSPFTLIIKGH